MSNLNLEAIADLVIGLRLVSPHDLSVAHGELPPSASGNDLLKILKRRQLLTDLQATRIQRGDHDGLVLGDYKLMYRNAAGSFARVYRACSVVDGSMVGVKVLRERWAADSDMVKLFHREGDIGKRLKHANIVPLYQVAVQGKFHYILMEFIEGGNLRDFLRIRGRLEPLEACKYTLHMTQALEYAFGMGVTHRDLKLTNVLMSSQGVAKLIDFGLAADEATVNRAGGVDLQQALEYSTLERNTGAPKNDPRSDLYFLGGILYELLCGEPPYPRTADRDERKRFGRYRDVRPIAMQMPEISLRLGDLVNRLMHISPSERYQTPTEVIADLRLVMTELGGNTNGRTSGNERPTVMCVEHRTKQQDLLRDYLSRHGFRVLVLSDIERALTRLSQQPPDCILLMGDAIGDRVAEDFMRAQDIGRERQFSVVCVLSEKQKPLRESIPSVSAHATVLQQPVILRRIRTAIEELCGVADADRRAANAESERVVT
ncbi:MAG: protein kinase [Maioricimonas sp. JB049]